MILPHQHAHQPVGEIIKVVQAVAQIMIGGTQHARARIRLHAFDAGLRGEAGHDGLANSMQPTLIVREHAVGFEHVTMLATIGDVAMLDQPVEIFAQGSDRGVEPLEFVLHVVGDDVGDDHAWLVQHDVTECDAVGQRTAREMHRVPRDRFRARAGE